MPRFILKQAPKIPGQDKLVKRLVQELKAPGDDLQPLILEQIIESTNSRHVHVIWDRWRDVSDEHRSRVIEEAYSQVDSTAAGAITLASGMTPEEAVVLGLLPYKVVPMRERHEAKPPMAEYKKVLKNEASNTVLGTRAAELRYARLEDAEAAKRRLEKALPSSEWAIVQEVPYES
jgi:hypothetical protein